MAASINFGGTIKDSNTMSGVVSGIDAEKLIEASVAQKSKPIKAMEKAISLNTEKIAAYAEFETKLKNLQNSAKALYASVDGDRNTENKLAAKNVITTSDSGEAATNYISVIAGQTAAKSDFEIEVLQLAKAKAERSTAFSSTTANVTQATGDHTDVGQFTEGTFQINGIDITISAGDSLSDIVGAINAANNQTKVTASIIEPTPGSFNVMLSSDETGTANEYTITDTDAVLNNIISGGVSVETAQNSQFNYNGMLVERSSNTVSDFVLGQDLTIKLHKQTAGAKISVGIEYDINAATAAVGDFINSYNELVKFSTQQKARDADGNWLDSAKLRRSDILSNSGLDLNLIMGGVVLGDNLNYNTLADVGIKFEDVRADIATGEPGYRNLMTIDADKFISAVQSNFEDVAKIFEFQYTSTDSNFAVLKRSNNLTETQFSIDMNIGRAADEIAQITYGATTINAVFTPTDSGDLTKGGMITGAAGTIFEGFSFHYAGTGVDTSDFTVTQGIADKVYNSVGATLAPTYKKNVSDTIATVSAINHEVSNLQTENDSKTKDIEKINVSIEAHRKLLVEKYARLEKQIAYANSMLAMFDAQLKAMESN